MVNTRHNKYTTEESKVPPKTSHFQGETSHNSLFDLDSPQMGSNTNDWSKAFEGYGKQAQSVGSEEEERPRFEHNPFGSDSDEEILEDEYKKLKQSKRIHKLLERI